MAPPDHNATEAPQTMHLLDCRALALVIANAYPCGYLERCTIGVTWSPRNPRGRPWTAQKCERVLQQLLAFGLCSLHENLMGTIVRVTESGYQVLDIQGAPAIRDLDAERRIGPYVGPSRRWAPPSDQ